MYGDTIIYSNSLKHLPSKAEVEITRRGFLSALENVEWVDEEGKPLREMEVGYNVIIMNGRWHIRWSAIDIRQNQSN